MPSPEDVDLGPAEGTRNSVASVEVDPLLNGELRKISIDDSIGSRNSDPL